MKLGFGLLSPSVPPQGPSEENDVAALALTYWFGLWIKSQCPKGEAARRSRGSDWFKVKQRRRKPTLLGFLFLRVDPGFSLGLVAPLARANFNCGSIIACLFLWLQYAQYLPLGTAVILAAFMLLSWVFDLLLPRALMVPSSMEPPVQCKDLLPYIKIQHGW